MTGFCTYCSARKRPDAGLLPAIERYESERIRAVYDAAQRLGVRFAILSGQFGLIGAEHPTPDYDRLLTDAAVPTLLPRVRAQIVELGLSHLVYFTRAITRDNPVGPYQQLLVAAAHSCDAVISLITLPPDPQGRRRVSTQ